MVTFTGLFTPGIMTYTLDRTEDTVDPTLTEMAIKAVEMLSSNPNGFFLVVESGMIDVAHHRGLAARSLHETILLSDTVQALEAITNPSETLILGL